MAKKNREFKIQGITYVTPNPPHPDQILNNEFTKLDQYWRRVPVPKTLDGLSEKDGDALFAAEWEKIINGCWFYNKGIPTFITGYHYYFLTHYNLEDGTYPDYRRTDRDFFYFWDYLEKKTRALGCIFVKYRRQGASSRGASMMSNIGITEERARCGVISKTGTDAEDFFMDMVSTPFQSLPDWLKPRQSGNSKSRKEIIFAEPPKRLGATGKTSEFSSGGLNNRLMARNTALNSFDSGRLRFLVIDEGGKFPKEVPIYRYWQIVKKVLTKGGTRVGMCYMMSTVNEMEKAGGREFKVIYSLSKHITKEGKEILPPSGLYSFFIPADDGYPGYISKWGDSISVIKTDDERKWLQHLYEKGICPDPTVGAREYILNKRKALQETIDRGEIEEDVLHEEIRTEPLSLKEAFLEPAKDCIVPANLLNQQIDWLEENIHKIQAIKRRGNFIRDTRTEKVIFYDDPNGRFERWWDFKDPERESNRWTKDRKGKKTPANTKDLSIGVDQFSHTITAGSEGSMAGGHIYLKFNPLDPENSDLPVGEYYARPKLKSILFNDMMLAGEYFGCKVAFEASTDDWYEYFLDHGMENYLVMCPASLMGKAATNIKPGIPMTSQKAIDYHTTAVVEHFINNYKKIYSLRLLEQIRHFDPNDRTAYDLVMSWGYALLAAKETTVTILPKQHTSQIIQKYKIQMN